MPQDGKPENNLVSGDMIWRYLDKFASDNDLKRHIRFNSWVSDVRHSPQGTGWTLTVNGITIETAKLICATGVTTQINSPGFSITDNPIPVIHAVDIAKSVAGFSDATNKFDHFVLIGAAKSAYDAAYLLCSLGKKVTWIIREDGSGPMPIMPTSIMGMVSQHLRTKLS